VDAGARPLLGRAKNGTLNLLSSIDPGFTWTPYFASNTNGRRNWDASSSPGLEQALPTATQDRIGMIYASGNLEPLAVLVLGDEGDSKTDVGFEEWPSDHRAVLAKLRWFPRVVD
jgi:hypothetical protein